MAHMLMNLCPHKSAAHLLQLNPMTTLPIKVATAGMQTVNKPSHLGVGSAGF